MTFDRNALLAEILQLPVDSSTWVELTRLINSWPESEGLEAALDRAEAALEAWPDELRTGDRWWDAASKGREPRWRLARSIGFSRRGRQLSELTAMSANEAFARVTSLSIKVGKGPELVDELLEVVAKGKDLSHIRSLNLTGREIGLRGAKALAKLALPALEVLDVSANGLGKMALTGLLSAPWSGQLRKLDLAENLCDLGAAQALAAANLGALQTLNLKRAQSVTDDSIAALAACELPELLELSLEDCRFGPDGMAALAAAGHWKKLSSLNLWGMDTACGNDGAKALAKHWAFPALSVLNIGGCKIGDSGAKALAGCDGMASVHTLDIARSEFTSRGMTALANSKAFSGVKSIQMNWCKVNAIKAMGGTNLAKSIEELQIPRTSCGDDGLLALLEGDGLSQIRLLDLTKNKLTDSGVEALVGASDKLKNLRTLIAGENAITGKGLGLLCNSKLELHSLNVERSKLGSDVAKTITSSPLTKTLRDLNLRRSGLDDSGFAELCSTEFPGLRRLEVDAKAVTVDGLNVMVEKAANFPSLREFDFAKSLFDAIPKDQREVLKTCFSLGRAAVNAGAYYISLPEFKPVIEKTEKPKERKVEELPTAVFELPEAETEVSIHNCSRLEVVGQIGLGPIREVRWLSEERVLLATANGLFHYELDTGHVEEVSQFAQTGFGISEDGGFIAAQMPWWKGGLLDVETDELTTWEITTQKAFSAVAFSPDNAVIAILSDHATERGKSLLRLRQRETGEQTEFTLDVQNRRPSMCWSPDGKYIAIGSGSSHCIVHASGELKVKWVLGSVDVVRFSRDSASLITATCASNMKQSGDTYLRVWDLDGNQLETVATPHDGMYSDLNAITTHPDGVLVAVGGRDQHVHVFESGEWARKHLLKAADLNPYVKDGGGWAEFNVSHLAFSNDGSRLLICTAGKFASLQIWDTSTWERIAIHCDFVGKFNEFTLADDGNTIALATDSQARSYRSGEPSPVVYKGWKGPYVAADVDHFRPLSDGKRAVLTCGTNHEGFTFGLLDLATMELDIPFSCKTPPQVMAVRTSDDVIATGDEKGRIALWKPGRKTPLAKPTRHHAEVEAIKWSADGTTLVSCADDGKVRVWDATTERERFAHQASGDRPTCGECAVSDDGSWVAATVSNRPRGGPYTGKLFIWGPDKTTPMEFVAEDKKGFNALAFSPTTDLLAVGDTRGRIRLIRRSDASQVAECKAHAAPITHIAFDPTGCLLYSMTWNAQIKIWGVGDDESDYFIAAAPVEPEPTAEASAEPAGDTYAVTAAPEPVAETVPEPVVEEVPEVKEPPKVVNWEPVEAGSDWIVKHENVYILKHADAGWMEMRTHEGKAIRGSWSDKKGAEYAADWSHTYNEPISEQNKLEIDELVKAYLGLYEELKTGETKISILLDLPEEKKAVALLGGTPMRLLFKQTGWAVVDLSGNPVADVSNAMWSKQASPSYGKFHDLGRELADAIVKGVSERGDETTVIFDPPLVPPPPPWQATHTDVEQAVKDRNADELRRIFTEGNLTPQDGVGDKDLLHLSARNAYLEGAKMALEAGCDPNSVNMHEYTPLFMALEGCKDIKDGVLAAEASEGLAIVELLLESGADPAYVFVGYGTTMASTACKFGCTEEAIRLLKGNDALMTALDNGACQPIHLAAMGGHIELMEWLVDNGADPNVPTPNDWGTQPINWAAQNGQAEAVRWLIEHGVDPHTSTNFKLEPIHVAAMHARVEVIDVLVGLGVDPATAVDDNWGTQPIHYAATNGHLETVKRLLEHGADAKALNKFDVQPIHSASEGGHVDVMTWLAEHGADLAVGDTNGWLSIHFAANNGRLEAVKWLVEKGADPKALNDGKFQPIHQAAQNGHLEVVKWLVESGVDPLTATGDDWGSHPIHNASVGGHIDTVKWLLEHGEDVNCADKYGFTPLHEAAAGNQLEAAKALVELGADKTIECTGDTGDFKPGTTPKGVAEHHTFEELVAFLS